MLTVAMAVVVVGCGGGGGGSKSVFGGSSGGSASPAVGQITTGGTTGEAVTTGSLDGGTTGFATTGSTGSTGTSATTGTTGTTATTATTSTTGTTSSLSTQTSGSTGATDGSTTSTTGGTTTGDASTGSTSGGDSTTGTTGGTTGGSPSGDYRRANAIFFGRYTDTSSISSVLPDGTARQDLGGSDGDVVAAIADPTGGYVYAKSVNGLCGIYRGTTFQTSASKVLAAPHFDYVSTLQPTSSGAVIVVGAQGGANGVYLLADGNVTLIDNADDAAVTVDGSKVAYTKSVGSYNDLFVWDRATNETTSLETGGDAILPSFSKDGAWILFSSSRDRDFREAYDLYQIRTTGGAVERITNTPFVSEVGGCYNETRTMISCVGQSGDPNLAGLYVISNAGATRIATDDDLNMATYWTDSQGRSLGRKGGGRFQVIRHR